MARRKNKSLPTHRSPLEVAAADSITSETKSQHEYCVTRYAERDHDGGVSLNGMRLERLACVKALEGLARSHPKRKERFLEAYHLMAANNYHADLIAVEGRASHAFMERIDSMTVAEGGLMHRLDVLHKMSKIEQELGKEMKSVLARILVDMPEHSMAQIWPDRASRDKARELIKAALHKLAILYGLVKA